MDIKGRGVSFDLTEDSDRRIANAILYGFDAQRVMNLTRETDIAHTTEHFTRAVMESADVRFAYNVESKPTILRALRAALEFADAESIDGGNLTERGIDRSEVECVLPLLQEKWLTKLPQAT
jgi:hypothetical protein